MPDGELKALGDLAAEYADKAVTSTVQGVHTAISGRVFDAVGAGSQVARTTHDAVSDGLYGALRLGGYGVGMAISGASRLVGGEEERQTISSSRFGRATQAAINGLIGDRLEDEESALRIKMALRLPGRDVDVRREDLEDAFDENTDRLVVFLHGLCETEEAWWLGTRADPAADAPAPRTYGARLRDDLGFSPLYLRYNSGLHVSENGRRLSWLLEELCREWPVEVRELALVGHSMGALVARSACHEAADEGRAWLGRTRHLVCLGAPNTGSWLEKFVNIGGWALRHVPESRPFADFLELRSPGIRDLRFGYLRDEDWLGHDPDGPLRNRAAPLVPVPGIAYHFVSGGLTASERHPVATVFGDVLVRRSSAGPPRGADGESIGDGRHVQGASHFHLLNHPSVYAHMREWLSAGTSGDETEISLTA
jgi:pimeloyl-ACP methyl ester carboxylesterase